MGSVEILPNILKNLHQFYTISSKKQNRREHFSTHSVKPVLLWEQNQRQNHRLILIVNLHVKILNRISANRTQPSIKGIPDHYQVGFITDLNGWFNISKLISPVITLCCCLVTKPCLTLCDLMDCSLPGSPVHEIFQARILEQVAISFSRGSSQRAGRASPNSTVFSQYLIAGTQKY